MPGAGGSVAENGRTWESTIEQWPVWATGNSTEGNLPSAGNTKAVGSLVPLLPPFLGRAGEPLTTRLVTLANREHTGWPLVGDIGLEPMTSRM